MKYSIAAVTGGVTIPDALRLVGSQEYAALPANSPEREVITDVGFIDTTPTLRQPPTANLINGQVEVQPGIFAATVKTQIEQKGFDPRSCSTKANPSGYYSQEEVRLFAWNVPGKFTYVHDYPTLTPKPCASNNGEKDLVLSWNPFDTAYMLPDADHEVYFRIDETGKVLEGGVRPIPTT